ncbi:MAG: S6e family ribosomal protein [Candidatus Micrarchaeia archaeon]
MKIVYSDRKTGMTAQAEVPKDKEALLIGNSIGDTVDGSIIGLNAYKLMITGLSDKSGTPSLMSMEASRKAYALMYSKNAGKKKGKRARRLVRGRTIAADTEQINTVIVEYGEKPASEIFKPKQDKSEQKEEKGA